VLRSPNGAHDDQVDAMTQMLLYWNTARRPTSGLPQPGVHQQASNGPFASSQGGVEYCLHAWCLHAGQVKRLGVEHIHQPGRRRGGRDRASARSSRSARSSDTLRPNARANIVST